MPDRDSPPPAAPLVTVREVKKHFPISGGLFHRQVGAVRAVDGVSLELFPGETLALVGESGCGKSTLGRLILGLEEPTSGQIFFKGVDIVRYDKKTMRQLRRKMQIVFQDPYSSLNPRKRIINTIGDPLLVHGLRDQRKRTDRVFELMELVGLDPEQVDRFPHQFSGGQRQRIGLARALALNPELLVCDEPVSALDVSVQSQVLNLLQNLQRRLSLTYLFISHDLSVVDHLADRVAVMYLGRIVELADKESLYADPRHPYTEALLSACPIPDPFKKKNRIILRGDVPSPINPPPGCHFSDRCHHARPVCEQETPPLLDVDGTRQVACFMRQAHPAF